ncbi:MAG: efflux RND transporter periplasmic adaptor subunit [Cyclobacteriaceae bacterium]|nr:efflux RND transporter periplasmic adaptor subunit [Cyclobacteriaceae bacterium]
MYHYRYTNLMLVALLLTTCNEKSPQEIPLREIQVIEVIQRDVPIYQEFVGQVYGALDIPIRARVEGFLEHIHFDEGKAVKKGQLLYTIDSEPFRAEVAASESKVAEAQTYLVNAANELDRYEPLAEINAVSKSDLDAAKATKEAAESSLKAARANLELARIKLGYCAISSPIDGLIGKSDAQTGEFVGRAPNPVILNVVSKIREVRVQFFITETEYLNLARMQSANINVEEQQRKEPPKAPVELQLILADGQLYDQPGHVDFIDRSVDASTGSILIQATFPNPAFILRPGMFAKVKVKGKIEEDALLVPQRCIMELQGQRSVFVVDDNNVVKAVPVVATERLDDLWLISEGLNAGDKIVMDDLQKAASGLEVKPVLVDFESISTKKSSHERKQR